MDVRSKDDLTGQYRVNEAVSEETRGHKTLDWRGEPHKASLCDLIVGGIMRRALSVQLFLAVFGASLSCHNSTAPSAPPATVGGDYRADQFVTTGSSGQTNQIVAGSSLFLYLAGDGTVSGQLNMAASGGNPAFAADMTGTWTRSGNTITFSQAADTFVRNMTFALEPNMRNLSNIVRDGISWQLVGDQVISGTRIQIRLSYFVTIASILRAAHIYLNQRA